MILKLVVLALAACQPAPALKALFTPARPALGSYEVCTIAQPLAQVRTVDMRVDKIDPLDAFGGAGPYNRAALARLYGGTRVQVARGWTERGREFESDTLISPYPDPTLTHLIDGTLVIRFRLSRGV